MIIFAHCNPPGILFQLRNFDVPLMVIVSGMSFSLVYSSKRSYLNYFCKRFKRLLMPVWFFLSIYFIGLHFLYPSSMDLHINTMVSSFLLVSGIGYVWVIRVFLMIALISPLLYQVHSRFSCFRYYYFIIAAVFVFYEVFRFMSIPYVQDGFGYYFSLYFYYLISYSIVFLVGMSLLNAARIYLWYFAFICLSLFFVFAILLFMRNGGFLSTQGFKNPPSLYYFSYSLFVSVLLWLYSSHLVKLSKLLCVHGLVFFISRNTMWIYLWHIPFVKFVYANYILKYLFVFAVSYVIVRIQVFLVEYVIVHHIADRRIKEGLESLFIG